MKTGGPPPGLHPPGGSRGGLSCTHAGVEIRAGGGWGSLTVHLQDGPDGPGEVCGFLGE